MFYPVSIEVSIKRSLTPLSPSLILYKPHLAMDLTSVGASNYVAPKNKAAKPPPEARPVNARGAECEAERLAGNRAQRQPGLLPPARRRSVLGLGASSVAPRS